MLDPDKVYTLDDLNTWPDHRVSLAVIGYPIHHSLSPAMHNAALEHFKGAFPELHNWTYYRFQVKPEELPAALSLFHEKGFIGLNLTLPHKVEAVPLVYVEQEDVRRMGAVNTLLINEHGYTGYNTDGYGLSLAMRELSPQKGARTYFDKDVILLGAGGASRGAAVQILKEGCRTLWIGNRTVERLNEMLSHKWASDGRVRGFTLDNIPQEIPEGAFLINGTSLGLQWDDPSPIDFTHIPQPAAAFDMVYRKDDTSFVKEAKEHHVPVANGLDMLVWQGALALEYWTRTNLPNRFPTVFELYKPMKLAADAALAEQV